MSTPVKRHTKAARNSRRSHFALKNAGAVNCADCGAATMPHQACQACGKYKGKKVINVEKREVRRAIHQKPMQKSS